jgi:copper oxidase (laccase) domain-containing protein
MALAPTHSANMSLEVGDEAEEAVRANRAELRRMLGIRSGRSCGRCMDRPCTGYLEDDFFEGITLEGDGLCTSRPGHALVIKTADCQAILLAHKPRPACRRPALRLEGQRREFSRSRSSQILRPYG